MLYIHRYAKTAIYMVSSSKATYTTESCVRGYQVYKDVSEELQCARESSNSMDHYSIAIMKGGKVVGNVPRKISRVCALSLEHIFLTYIFWEKISRFWSNRENRKHATSQNFPAIRYAQ